NQTRGDGVMCGTTMFGPAKELVLNATLRSVAEAHSEDMAHNDYAGHEDEQGHNARARAAAAGYDAEMTGEDIVLGRDTPEGALELALHNDGNCSTLMNPKFREIGIGYGYNGFSTDIHYWTFMLAVPRGN